MKKKIAIVLASMFLVTNVQIVTASEIDQSQIINALQKNQDIQMFSDGEKVIESVVQNEDGEIIINYSDFPVIEDEPAITNISSAKNLEIMKAKATELIYTSTLGPENNYSLLRARSEATDFINFMLVSVDAYRDNGRYIGQEIKTNDEGTIVMSLSAKVQPLDFGLNYQVGSGYSTHQYYCEGYEVVVRSLQWAK